VISLPLLTYLKTSLTLPKDFQWKYSKFCFSFVSLFVSLISILTIYLIFQNNLKIKTQNNLKFFHKCRMIDLIEMNVLLLILIWEENVKIPRNFLNYIRNNQFLNQNSFFIDDKYPFANWGKESLISSLFHFEGYVKKRF
jgi:hypothetical protein